MKSLFILSILWVPSVYAFLLKDCANVVNARYALGECEPRFLKCSDGIPVIVNCPSGLIYNEKKHFCDRRQNVAGCGYAQFEAEDDNQSEIIDEPENELKLKNNDDFIVNVCENLEDGIYSAGFCTRNYFTCNSGVVRIHSCWPLHYDPMNKECGPKDLIEECRKEKNLTNATNPKKIFGRMASQKGEKALIKHCSKKADGTYPMGHCSEHFLTCHGLEAKIMQCLDNSVFDPSRLVCDSPSNVTNCSGLKHSNMTCKEDGYFSVSECSSSFIVCKNGTAFDIFCPSGFKFSQKKQTCDISNNIQECPKTPEKGSDGYLVYRYEEEILGALLAAIVEFEKETGTEMKLCLPNAVLGTLIFRYRYGFDMKLEELESDCLKKVIQLSIRKIERDRREIEELKFLIYIILGIFTITFVLKIILA